MNPEIQNKLYKKSLSAMTLTVFILFTVYSFVLTTLYVKAETDIAFNIPFFVDIIPLLTDLCEIVAMVTAYTFIIYAFRRFDKRCVTAHITAFVILTLYKYLAKIAVTYIINGALPVIDYLISDLFWALALPILLEYAQLAIITLIVYFTMKKAFLFIREKKALEGRLPDYSFNEDAVFFPFTRIFNKDNPLQRSAFGIGIVVMASKMLQLLIVDITVGLPQDLADFFWIVASYSLCVILGFASYLFTLWLLMAINSREIKLKYSL